MSNESIDYVPKASFNSREFARENCLAAFRALTRDLYEIWPRDQNQEFIADAEGYRVNGLVYGEVAFSPARFRRGLEHLRGVGSDFLVLEAMLEGEQLLMMDHGHVQMRAGNIYLRDWAHPFEAEASAMRLMSILIPRQSLKASSLFQAHNAVLSWSTSDPAGRLLLSLWSNLFVELATAEIAVAESLARAFLEFLDSLLGYDKAQVSSPSLGSIQQFLLIRLRSNVQMQDLCEHFDISRSTLYRLFKPLGGLNKYLLETRLQRCYTDLYRADPDRSNIGAIAASWGFDEASSFSRRFKNKFGVSPSAVLGAGSKNIQNSSQSDSLKGSLHYKEYVKWMKFG